jgi:formylglycine-generating enzyme required for sulfatase activity
MSSPHDSCRALLLRAACVVLSSATCGAQDWAQIISDPGVPAPSARSRSGIAHDPVSGRSWLFGGQDHTGVPLSDFWAFDEAGWQPQPLGSVPPGRWAHGLVQDTRRSRLVLFGGFQPRSGNPNPDAIGLDDTWEFDGTSWNRMTPPVAPSPRGEFGIAYDPVRGRTVLFGGVGTGPVYHGDTWEWDGARWAEVVVATGPSARRGAAMACDLENGGVLLFGGGAPNTQFGDTWSFDGTAWVERAPSQSPLARLGSTVVFDPQCGELLLHGGRTFSGRTVYGDAWRWDGSTWAEVQAASLPTARHSASATFDLRAGRALLVGGRDAAGPLGDTWERSSCERSMTTITPALVGRTAQYRYRYPAAAAQNLCMELWTLHDPSASVLQLPGFVPVGLTRVDPTAIFLQSVAFLDGSGERDTMPLVVPNAASVVGFRFDVQCLDWDSSNNFLYWSGNDIEETVVTPGPPLASFTATPSQGAAPLFVQFTNTSTNFATSWAWDFENDGVVDSTLRNPSFTYTTPGLYTVRMVASSQWGSTDLLMTIFAGVPDPALGMVLIDPGTFLMGTTASGVLERPVHQVTLTWPFWIARHEVTQAEYAARTGTNPSEFVGPNQPVEKVSWEQAIAYCDALTAAEVAAGRVPAGYEYRLPTEAEWEYCCRAGTTTEYSFGASITPADANYGTYVRRTTDVGTYPANPWGLHDMHGNVWEWCMDANAPYTADPVADPFVRTGPVRIIRGGSWVTVPISCRSATRNYLNPDFDSNSIGFRLVLGPILVR